MPRLSYSSLSFPEPEKNGIGWEEGIREQSMMVVSRSQEKGRWEKGEKRNEWKDSGEMMVES